MSLRELSFREVIDYDNMVNRRVNAKTKEFVKVSGDPIRPPSGFERRLAFDLDSLLNSLTAEMSAIVDRYNIYFSLTNEEMATKEKNNPLINSLEQQLRDLQEELELLEEEAEENDKKLPKMVRVPIERRIEEIEKELKIKSHL